MTPAEPEGVARRYRELLAIHRLITATLDRSAVMSTVTTQAVRLLNAEAALLMLRERDELRIASLHNVRLPDRDLRIPCDREQWRESIRALGRATGFSACTCVPLQLRGELRGALAVFGHAESDTATEDQVLLTALADQTAIALENTTMGKEIDARTKALGESEQLFRLALEEAPIGVALVSLDGRVLEANNVLCDLVGYPRDELLGMAFPAFTHPDDLGADLDLMEKLIRGDIPRYQLAKRYVRKDGRVVEAMLNASLARGPDGEPLYGIAHVEDVTEHKLADDKLRQIQERYELALRGADLATWDWNIVTGEVAYNRRWAEVRGYRPEEVKPQVESWVNGVHPDDWPNVQRVMTDYLEGRIGEYEVEHRIRTRAGEWIWILDRGKVFARDERGRPIRMVGIEVEINDYKRLQQKLHETNATLDRAQSVAKTGSWRLDVGSNKLEWSPEMYRIFGVPSDYPVSYESFLALVHPDDRDEVDRVWTTAIRGASSYDVEHRILVAGEVRWLREKADLEYNERGEHVLGIGTAQDITDRKQSDEALRLAEARSSGILSVSPDAIISIDDGYHITLFNDGAVTMLGYSKDEAIGASLDLVFPERLRTKYRQLVTQFADGREASRRMGDLDEVIVGCRKNGAEFPADVGISKLYVDGTRILTIALRDMTEQARAANEQRFLADAGSVLAGSLEYEETLTRVAELAVQDLADLCIVDIVDESGEIRRLRVISRNECLRDVCERMERHSFDDSRPFLLRTTLQTKRSLLIRSISPETLPAFAQSEEHLDILRAISPTSLITVPMLAYDRLVGGLGLVSTRRAHLYRTADVRLAEELARRAALSIENARLYRSMRRAVQARDELMGIVAHDLRTPLSAVRMQAQLFQMYDGGIADPAKKAADMIDRATARMSRLIDDLLDISRLEAGRLHVEQARLSAAELVADSAEMQKVLAERAELELCTETAPDLPEVYADRNRVLQILENLVGNAIKFTPAGGRVTIGAVARGGEVVFFVRDTGAGIANDALAHVFDRFWQAQRDDRRGAGLGLAITRGIVEAHGGRVWVESALGEGTTFYFTIPLAPAIFVAPEPSPSAVY